MINVLNKPAIEPHIGRPTIEYVKYRQELHAHNQLMKECHARVVTLEAKVYMQSNIIQRLMLENAILTKDLNLITRM